MLNTLFSCVYLEYKAIISFCWKFMIFTYAANPVRTDKLERWGYQKVIKV